MATEDSEDSPQEPAAARRYSSGRPVENSMPTPTVDALSDPVIGVDPQGILRYGNERAMEVLGWDTNILGTSVLDLIHPDDMNIVVS